MFFFEEERNVGKNERTDESSAVGKFVMKTAQKIDKLGANAPCPQET